jgi:hypothetical protein
MYRDAVPSGYSFGGRSAPVNNMAAEDRGFGSAFQRRPDVTQDQLIRMAEQNAPPRVMQAMNGQPIAPRQALKSQGTDGGFMRALTARQLMSMDQDELGALGTFTNTKFNAPLPYVMDQTQRLYGPSAERGRGFGSFV